MIATKMVLRIIQLFLPERQPIPAMGLEQAGGWVISSNVGRRLFRLHILPEPALDHHVIGQPGILSRLLDQFALAFGGPIVGL
jgi:hypothetical protein